MAILLLTLKGAFLVLNFHKVVWQHWLGDVGEIYTVICVIRS